LLSSTLPLSFSSRDTPPQDVAAKPSKASHGSLFTCPCCKLSLKVPPTHFSIISLADSSAFQTRDDLVLHLRSCPQLGAEDITSTRSDSFLMRSNTPVAKKSSPIYHRDDGSVHKETHSRTTPPGACPFCGKAPLSKSGLSAHLLSCQKKKESKERREAHVAAAVANAQIHPERRNTPQKTSLQRTPSPAPQNTSRTHRGVSSSEKTSGRTGAVSHVSRSDLCLGFCASTTRSPLLPDSLLSVSVSGWSHSGRVGTGLL
jgi:hypothetical protein